MATVISKDNKKFIVSNCLMCNNESEIEVTEDQANRFNDRSENIQNILPNVSPGEREILISGICGDCFDNMFG